MKKSYGLSLIELMIAMAISALLGIILVQYYANQKVTATELNRENRVKQELRFINRELGRWLAVTGFTSNPQDSKDLSFPAIAATADCPNMPSEVVITPDKAKLANAPGFCFRFQRAYPGQTDCLGNEITSASITSRIFIDPVNHQLKCSSQGKSGVLANQVADMRIKFLIASSTSGQIQRKVSAHLTDNASYDDIKAVEIALLGRSKQSHPDAPDFYFPPGADTKSTPDDKHFYTATSTTFSLKNINL